MLDAARKDHVRRSHRDLAGAGRDRRQRPRAHSVDREPGNRVRQAGQQGDVAPERQPLVSHLGRGREVDVVDAFRRQRVVAAKQFAHELDGHVVGTRAPENALRPGSSKRAADAVDVVDLAKLTHRDKASRRGHKCGCVPGGPAIVTLSLGPAR